MEFAKKNRRVLRHALNIAYPVISAAILFLAWAIAAAAIDEPLILPPVGETLSELFRLFGYAYFWQSFFSTVLRSILSFALSFILAAVLALLSLIKPAGRIISPIITFFRAVPTMAVIFLFILWAGSGTAPVLVAFLIIMPTLYSALYSALRSVDGKLLEMAAVYAAPKKSVLKNIVLPSVAPYAVESAAGGLTLCVKLVVAAEALAQTAFSLGSIMQQSNIMLETARLMAVTAAAVLVCYLIEYLIRLPLKFMNRRKV